MVSKVIAKERPDGILLQFGGQTALNCGIELEKSGILEQYGVRVLGTPIEAIVATEDRDIFSQKLREINEKIAEGEPASTVEEAVEAAARIRSSSWRLSAGRSPFKKRLAPSISAS